MDGKFASPAELFLDTSISYILPGIKIAQYWYFGSDKQRFPDRGGTFTS